MYFQVLAPGRKEGEANILEISLLLYFGRKMGKEEGKKLREKKKKPGQKEGKERRR